MYPDARFTAQGLRARICKACNKLPKEKQEHLEVTDELKGLVAQANLSAKNIARLKVLAKGTDATLRTRAQVLLEVALVHPQRSKRIRWLREKNPVLLDAFAAAFEIDLSEGADANPQP